MMERIPALSEIPASALAVLAERLQHQTRYGHTPEADDATPANHLIRLAYYYALDGADILGRQPDARELERARRKAIKAAALCLAQIERLDRALKPAVARISNQGVPRK